MKLIYKIVLLYMLIALAVFSIGGVITYHVFKDTIDLEQRRQLKLQLKAVKESLADGIQPRALNPEKLEIKNLGTDAEEVKVYFTDTLAKHPVFDQLEANIMLKTVVKIDSNYYYISMYDLMVEQSDIEEGVSASLLKIFLLLLGAMVVTTFILSKLLFKPFEETLEKIKRFRLKEDSALAFEHTTTSEFTRLNEFLTQMTEKVKNDYLSLKEFSENASHEILTPLSIVKGKLELLVNSDNIKDEEIMLIQSAQQSISKLSRLSQSLTLLTKIDNQEFSNPKKINLSKILNDQLFDFNELIAMKTIMLEKEIKEDVFVNIDPNLANILLTNLIQNAIKHNISSGEIDVRLSDQKLEISNTGINPEVEPEEFFERFKKGNQSEGSIGLGLSIVKKICDFNKFPIAYHYLNNQHNITISF